ncbi:unnamed protein product, partial [marine sediment metagenome]
MSNYKLTPEEHNVLNQLSHGAQYRKYFFDKASSFKWFVALQNTGYFEPTENPSPMPADGGGYWIPYWDVLPYLERLSVQHEADDYDEIVSALLKVISDVGGFRNDQGKCIDNHHTWASFATILSNLPTARIDLEILSNVSDWLVSDFGSMMQTSAVVEKLVPSIIRGFPETQSESYQHAVRQL